jgi:hypothetical protein
MQRLAKLKMAGEMLAPMFPQMQAEGIVPNIEAFIEEVMGHAGFKDGRRFFKFGQKPPEQGSSPEVMKAMEELKIKNRAIEARLEETRMKIQSEEARNHEDNITQKVIAEIRERGNIVRTAAGVHQARESRSHDAAQAGENRKHRFAETMAARDAQASAPKAAAPAKQPARQGMPNENQIVELLGAMKQRTDALEQVLSALVAHVTQGGQRSPMGMMPGSMPSPMGMQPA